MEMNTALEEWNMSAPHIIILKTVIQKLKMIKYILSIISGEVAGNEDSDSRCQVSAEVDGTNHKTSHDGMFKVVICSKNILICTYKYTC